MTDTLHSLYRPCITAPKNTQRTNQYLVYTYTGGLGCRHFLGSYRCSPSYLSGHRTKYCTQREEMKLVLATVIGACGLHSDTVNGLNATIQESVGSQGCQGDPHMPMGSHTLQSGFNQFPSCGVRGDLTIYASDKCTGAMIITHACTRMVSCL